MELIVYENFTNKVAFNNQKELEELLELGEFIKSKLGINDNPFKYVGNGLLYVSGIVGSLKCGDTTISILPKYRPQTISVELYLEKLLDRTVICSCENIDKTIFYNKKSSTQSDDCIYDILGKLFYKSLADALRINLISTNVDMISKTDIIKGKVLVQKQIAEVVFDGKIWCKHKRITNDNLYNKLLCWAGDFLSLNVTDLILSRSLRALSNRLNVKYDTLAVNDVKKMILPRKYNEYKICFEIAKNLFLKRKNLEGFQLRGTEITGFAIVMHRAFEYIVGHYVGMVARELGINHYQQASRLLAKENSGSKLDYYVRPDNILFAGAKHFVLDAKYKVLSYQDYNNNKPKNTDIYQMICSCIACHCSEAVLIYPVTYGFPAASWNTDVDVNGKKINVKNVAVDIIKDEDNLKEDILDIIKNTSFYLEMRR